MGQLLLLMVLAGAAPQRPADVAVVCPEAFRTALAPWLAHRAEQGHAIELLSTADTDRIRQDIRRIAKQGALRSVVLVGDVPAASNAQSSHVVRVPTFLVDAKVNIAWGSEPQIATDNPYADLDDDQSPDLAIGRLPADTPEELAQIVEKIVAYERKPDFGMWRRRINFVAGVGGFGKLTDQVIEFATKKLLTDGVPASYATTMTHACWRSPYCPDPRELCDVTLGRLNEGCLFWVYLGHGHARTLDQMRVPGGRHRIFDVRDVSKLDCSSGQPIALFMACYVGAFDAPQDCLAEEMLRQPGGPVAVVAGSRVTMPYAMAVLGNGLLKECFNNGNDNGNDNGNRPILLGDALLRAKRGMIADGPKDASRQVLDLVASVISPAPEKLAAERLEHVQLFNLLGDPLLRLRPAGEVKLQTPTSVRPGERFEIAGASPIAGRCVVELVARRDRLTFKPPARERYDESPTALSALNAIYQRANDPRWCGQERQIELGQFQTSLDVPLEARGPCHLRVFVEGREDFALGSADVEVRQE